MELLLPRTGELIGDSEGRRVEILSDHDALHATWSRFGPHRDGADLHVHERHSDLFYVIEGELTLALGPVGGESIAPAGTIVRVPPLVVHGFRNGADAEVYYLNFHVPGEGFADYLRARRDGPESSFDSGDPPPDGGRSPELASIGRGELVEDEIEIHEIRLEPGDTLRPPAARGRLRCLYVLEGSLALPDDVQAEAGTWVQLSERQALACTGSEPVRFLQIHA